MPFERRSVASMPIWGLLHPHPGRLLGWYHRDLPPKRTTLTVVSNVAASAIPSDHGVSREYLWPKKKSARTAAARPPDPVGALRIPRDLGHVPEAGDEAVKELLLEGGLGGRERVEDPQPILAGFHQTSAPQVREMPRDRWLREAQHVHDVPNAHLAFLEEVKDAKPGPIRERAKHEIDPVSGPSGRSSRVRPRYDR